MNQDAPKKKRRWYSRLLPSTLEGQVASVTALLLIVFVISVWVVRWWGSDNVAFSHAMTVGRFLGEFGLAVIIPIILYWGMRWWNRIEREEYPDIDRAWKVGINSLHVNGLSLDTLPVFLVLGSPSPEFENELMAASLSRPRIQGVPPETTVQHALRWYASSQAIYLFCTNTCALSALAQRWQSDVPQSRVTRMPSAVAAPIGPISQVVAPSTDTARAPFQPEAVDEGSVYGTVWPGDAARQPSRDDDTVRPDIAYKPQHSPREAAEAAPVPSQYDESPPGTLGPQDFNNGSVSFSSPPLEEAGDTMASLPSIDPSGHVERLRYVCQLLGNQRSPRCGINGVLTLLPFQLAQGSGRDLRILADSARNDVQVIQQTLGLRTPVTGMVVGLERVRGFEEFIERLDASFRFRRLGGRFDLDSRPTPERLNTHSDRICDAFEEWIYDIFRQPDAHKLHRGNRKLYWLLSRIRYELKPSLRTVLGDAFGCKADSPPGEDDSLLFSGCYFASVSPEAQNSAFVRGVVEDKMLSEQSQVEWNARSRFHQRNFRIVSVLAWVIFGVLFSLLLYRLGPLALTLFS